MTSLVAAFASHVAFDRPWWLLLLLAVPALAIVGWRSLGDFPRAQLMLQAALRSLVLAGVAVALAGPSLRRPARAVSAVALVDVSDSITDAALARARTAVSDLERAAAARGGPGAARLRVLRFADHPQEIGVSGRAASAELARLPPPAGAASDLALAVSLGAGLVDPAAIPRLLLISDGEATRGDLAAEAERLAARGVAIYALRPPPADAGDAAIVGLSAPDEVRPRAPFSLEVQLLSDHPGRARVRVESDGQAIVDQPERPVDLVPGVTTVAFTARVTAPGITAFRARLLPEGGDRHPENNLGVLAISAERDPRILYVEGELGGAVPFARALESEHLVVDVHGARGVPGRAELDRYDLVVLSDVARSALDDAQMQGLEGFVRDGGGLMMAGGAASFGSGGWAGSRLEALLPVRLDVPERIDEATLALALVIDKSGSMSGPKMDLTKEAARATAEMMPPADQIAVVVFDSQAAPVVRLQRAANRMRILGDIGRIQASGGTNILAGLREAIDELMPARARKKHVILLSDGQSPYEGIADLVDAAAAAQITISAVGVGEGADQTLLQMIATRGGGRFYHTRDPASIPRIFSRETSQIGRTSIVEEPTTVRVGKRVEVFAGIPLDAAPLLGGYAVTRPRREAELLLVTGGGAPLLARWQVGLGQVVAWTSDVKPRWSSAWMRWPSFSKFWAQLARATMRRRAANHFPIRAARAGDRVIATVDAIGADDRFLAGLDGTLSVTTVTLGGTPPPPRRIAFGETAPGRYEAAFRPDADAGALMLQASFLRGTTLVADATGRLTLPVAPELRPRVPPAPSGGATPGSEPRQPDGAALLAAVTARTGGRILTDPAALLDPGADQRETRQPVRTDVLLATLALFLIDVLLRRVRLDFLRPSRGNV
jgi:Ca-activated chloride channel homolog